MLTLKDIQETHKRILPYIYKTPQIYSTHLSSKNKKVSLKLESMQITGSFKLRGAINKILSLNEKEKEKGVIAVSTGNHGKGVAYAAKILGIADRVGSLEKGKDATLIITDGDPLEITTQVEQVYIQGKTIDMGDRHKALYEKYKEKYRQNNILK